MQKKIVLHNFRQPVQKIGTVVILLFVFAVSGLFAQDTTKRQTINITSSFKPVLRDAAKINFNAAPPLPDTNPSPLKYAIPVQQLYLNYQPVALNPAALKIDTVNAWDNVNYIKVGVGNVHLPFLQAGFSFGNNKNSFFNAFAQHYTSKGKLNFQKNSLTQVALMGTIITPKELEWTGKLGFKSDDYFLYGYRPSTLSFTKDQLRQRYQNINAGIALRNKSVTTFGLSYHPSLNIDVFNANTNKVKTTEANTVLHLPIEKYISKLFGIKLGVTADLTRYSRENKQDFINNLFYVTPSLFFKSPNFYMQSGVIPSWDNKAFNLLPNFMADITTNDQRFTIQAGWIGYFNKGSFQRFAGINPWIAPPDKLQNARVREIYGGFKGTFADHFTYSAKVAYNRYHNIALFVNDTIDGKTFHTVYASTLDAIQIHGEIGYTRGEDFSARAGITINQFSKISSQAEPWGLLPLELNAGLRWQVIKDLFVRADLFVFDGAAYRTVSKEPRKGEGAFDLNLGAEFKITKNLNLWLQMNNLFNNKYERWNQYEVFGFNMLGGVVWTFNN